MKHRRIIGLIGTLCFSTGVASQEAASIDLGGFDFIPAIDYSLAYDDNVARTNQGELDSWYSLISPEFILLGDFSTNRLQVSYRLSRADYASSDQDDYTDHLLKGDFHYEISNRHRLDFNAEFLDGHDDRGTGFSIGAGDQLTSPDRFENTVYGVKYSYGAETAAARLDFGIRIRELDYDGEALNFLARDRDIQALTATFYYQIAPRTDIVLDLGRKSVDYDISLVPEDPLDSDETRALIGVKWETTAATSGYAKVGYQEKEFDSVNRETFTGVDWEVGVIWEPLDYSRFELSTQNDTNETNGEGDFIDSRIYQVSWQHSWLDRLSTSVSASLRNDAYEGEVDVRKDDVMKLKFSTLYQFRRWVQFELAYLFDERDSNRDQIDFDRNHVALRARITL